MRTIYETLAMTIDPLYDVIGVEAVRRVLCKVVALVDTSNTGNVNNTGNTCI